MEFSKKFKTAILLTLILLTAGFFRFYQLDKIPPGLYPDVAINGTDALQSLQTNNYKLFYPENNGREGLIMWLDALSIYIFGISALALKIPGAIIGVLTVLGLYLLVRKILNNRIALLAAFFCATSFWYINFSRIGFRAIIVPFCLVFAFYFLWKAFKKDNKKTTVFLAIFSGIFFGLGFYTYPAFRLAVPLLFCVLGLWLAMFWKNKARFFKISVAMLLATLFTALPIGIYFLQNLQDFFGRTNQTSIFSAPNPLLAFGQSLALHLGMFNIYGDANWRHNYSAWPELFLPIGILFLIGLFVAARKLLRSNLNKNLKLLRFDLNSFNIGFATILLWFGFLLLPGVLTIEGVPHALRVIGAIPAVMILAAIGAIAIYDWLKPRINGIALKSISIIFILCVLIFGYWQYFIAWTNNPNTPGAFRTDLVEIANLTFEFHNLGYQTVVVANESGVAVPYPNGIPMPAQTIIFSESAHCYKLGGIISKKYCSPYSSFFKSDQINQISINEKTIIVPMQSENDIFYKLQKMFPQGQIKLKNNIFFYEINK